LFLLFVMVVRAFFWIVKLIVIVLAAIVDSILEWRGREAWLVNWLTGTRAR